MQGLWQVCMFRGGRGGSWGNLGPVHMALGRCAGSGRARGKSLFRDLGQVCGCRGGDVEDVRVCDNDAVG